MWLQLAHYPHMARGQQSIDLTKTLQRIRVPSFVADREGTITWLNDAAKSVFGDLVGRAFTAVVAPGSVATAQRQLERKRHGVPATDYEVMVVTADGQERRAEISSVRIEGGDHCHAVFGVVLLGAEDQNPTAGGLSLTPRQIEVLQLVARGASTAQIAEMLHLSRETVRNHVRHILRALRVHSRVEAVARAYESGLL